MASSIHEIAIRDWSDFVRKIAEKTFDAKMLIDSPYVFRGQADESWELKSSFVRTIEELKRVTSIANEKAEELERRANERFEQESQLHSHEHLIPDTPIASMVLAQHYGGPTRLLDWTRSIFVAAYFAAIDFVDRDGAIWVVDTTGLRSEEGSRKSRVGPHTPRFITPDIVSPRYVVQQSVLSFSPNSTGGSEQEQMIRESSEV